MRYNTFYGLLITTTLATLLLAADRFEWRATGVVFRVANRFPGSVAFIVQLFAAFFGVIHVAIICKLIVRNAGLQSSYLYQSAWQMRFRHSAGTR